MNTVLKPEVVEASDTADLMKRYRRLKSFAKLLDGQFTIPLTGQSIGLDGLLGLVPVAGDLISGAMSGWIIWECWKMKVPSTMLGRMVANAAGDFLVGTVPVAGDVLDVLWKANQQNIQILERYLLSQGYTQEELDGR